MTLSSDFQKLYVDGIITLYELDAGTLGAGILRFHSHLAFEDWEVIYLLASSASWKADTANIKADKAYDIGTNKAWFRNIIWQGEEYTPLSIQADGLEMRSDGKASTPSLNIANNINGIQGAVSAYCLQFNDFAGAKLKVITTLAKYLDAANFSDGNPTAANECKEQHWYIEQKKSENANSVVFELSNPIDFEGLKIPVRQISNYCNWAACGKYRGEECGYIGVAMFTEKDEPTDNPALDKCSGRLKSCRLRFGNSKPLSFGGFPASSLLGN